MSRNSSLKVLDKAAFELILIAGPALLLWAYTGDVHAAKLVALFIFLAKWLYNILVSKKSSNGNI